uniref:Uncharacterized protein n=1 Tax=Physcomitrium patens TaxID=3218 RepID=A0A7I3ZM27_PHYPA
MLLRANGGVSVLDWDGLCENTRGVFLVHVVFPSFAAFFCEPLGLNECSEAGIRKEMALRNSRGLKNQV